ncbi:hypothetical protein AAGG74_16640 [Bacillus mexicanus]|uniref:hypothetical protein n=1 Tax=Bacillus mexicanus TaxID=2834415 RepID=UPI003D1E681E
MKVVKQYEDNWDIILDGKTVGRIEKYGLISPRKTLYVKNKSVGQVLNQKDAIQKLNEFFEKNKKDIIELEKNIKELELGISQVEYQICIDVLKKEKDRLNEELLNLRSYDLI